MQPERSQQIDKIFQAALDLPAAERIAFLDQACAGDKDLRREVESLISSYERAGSFIEHPAIEVDARILATPSVNSLTGQSIGHYQIAEPLGTGGMGEVYLAYDKMGRKVALKVLPDYLSADEGRVRRFQQEARAILALNHPNIVTIYEIERANSTYFIATELVEGETLRQRMARTKLGTDEAIDITVQVATALTAAHKAGIIHRDIKPVKLTDFKDGIIRSLAWSPDGQQLAISRGTQTSDVVLISNFR